MNQKFTPLFEAVISAGINRKFAPQFDGGGTDNQFTPRFEAGGGGGGTPLRPATTSTLGGIIVGEDLQITEEGVLSVIKANSVEEDNTRPITAAAVYTEVGNINALLATI